MKWFKHDTDASIDAKLQELLLDYGAAGYGLYWYCIELIAQGVSENNITFELEHDARIIARNLNLTVQETKDMMKKMVELDLFSISKNQKIACYALAKRIDKSMTSNTFFREIISQIKQNHDFSSNSHDSVMINSDLVMQEEKRREEIREEEIEKKESKRAQARFTKPTIEEIKDRIAEMNYNIDAERFFNYYESNGWMVGRNKMRDWKAALTTWSKSNQPQQQSRPQQKESMSDKVDRILGNRNIQDAEVLG